MTADAEAGADPGPRDVTTGAEGVATTPGAEADHKLKLGSRLQALKPIINGPDSSSEADHTVHLHCMTYNLQLIE